MNARGYTGERRPWRRRERFSSSTPPPPPPPHPHPHPQLLSTPRTSFSSSSSAPLLLVLLRHLLLSSSHLLLLLLLLSSSSPPCLILQVLSLLPCLLPIFCYSSPLHSYLPPHTHWHEYTFSHCMAWMNIIYTYATWVHHELIYDKQIQQQWFFSPRVGWWIILTSGALSVCWQGGESTFYIL